MKTLKQIRIIIILLFLIFVIFSVNYFKSKKAETNKSNTTPETETFEYIPKIVVTPNPQDPNKQKLTEDILYSIEAKIREAIYDLLPAKSGANLTYSEIENPKATESGLFGGYQYTVRNNHDEVEWQDYFTYLEVEKDGEITFSKRYDLYSPTGIFSIKTALQNTKLVQIYTYGAHCCFGIVPITLKDSKIYVGNILDTPNVDIIKKEHFFIKDGKLFKIIFDDRFAYYDMSFAPSTMMFFPLIYQIDESGFVKANNLFKDYYEKLYQNTKKELSKVDDCYIDWEDDDQEIFLYAYQIYQYTIGYLAGHSRSELKYDLENRWHNLDFSEAEIIEIISEDIKPPYVAEKVTYYAQLKRYSTSGDMRFHWYDVKSKQTVDLEDEYSWFFAVPTNVPYDDNSTDEWVKYIDDNRDAIFKITGTRELDDCGYYGPDHCIQSVNIDRIETTN